MAGTTKLMTAGGGGVNITPASSIASDVTVQVPSQNCTLEVKGPTFSAKAAAGTTLSINTWTKINYTNEEWDTNNNFASSRFTPDVAGWYQINAQFGEGLSDAGMTLYMAIYKSGTIYKYTQQVTSASWYTNIAISGQVYCNGTTDYIEIYGYSGKNGYTNTSSSINYFDGFLVRAA